MQNGFLTTEDLAELIATNSGFTYNPITGTQPSSGYMVSLRGYELSENYQDLLDSLKIEEFIDNYIQDHADKILDTFYYHRLFFRANILKSFYSPLKSSATSLSRRTY